MLAIDVRFLHGWLRASGRGDGALMGTMGTAGGEWPPSPARLFAALVAGGGTGGNRRGPGDDSELTVIEQAGAPLIVADPDRDVVRTPLSDRYVVVDETSAGNVQNYPGRIAAIARPGVRLMPRRPQVSYVWPDLLLNPQQLDALSWRAARVGYLGTSDAPAHVQVADLFVDGDRLWNPDPTGTASIAVPYPGFLRTLDKAYAAFQGGRYVPGSTIQREVARYRPPGPAVPPQPSMAPPILLWARFDRPFSGHRVLAVSEAVKGLVLDSFGDVGTADQAPDILTGHNLRRGADRARFWPLPFVGPRGDGRIFGLCISLPSETPGTVIHRVRVSLQGGTLRVRGAEARTVTLNAGEPGSWTTNPKRWQSPATSWVSVSPVVLPRHPKGEPNPDDIYRLCQDTGLPTPVSFVFSRVPQVRGGLDLAPFQTVRKGNRPRPYGHLRIDFQKPVAGPIALGYMRSFGLGLMAPHPMPGRA